MLFGSVGERAAVVDAVCICADIAPPREKKHGQRIPVAAPSQSLCGFEKGDRRSGALPQQLPNSAVEDKEGRKDRPLGGRPAQVCEKAFEGRRKSALFPSQRLDDEPVATVG